ncbi:MAG TPA: site-2 protease family protein [Terriglobales bacterium]|nr:site-2 protease family protein [Terriglobales bacterium]
MSESNLPVPRYYPEAQSVESFWAPPRPRRRYWLHILLLLLTICTTLVVGTRLEANFLHNQPLFTLQEDALPLFPIEWIVQQPSRLLLGVPFAFSLMLILLAHEMGHYLMCLRYGVQATLPFFIPAPTLIGTLGAFIRIRSPIRSREALFDIGIAGPIAGFLVAIIVLLLALMDSRPLPAIAHQGDIVLSYPWIFRVVYRIAFPVSAAQYPLEALEMHPMAIAAWVGMFATALNLLPGGQLDGGHIVYALSPRAHKFVSVLTIGILLPLGYWLWPGWLIWAALLALTGVRHPLVPMWPGLSRGRQVLALLGLLLLVLTFLPAPIQGFDVSHW